MFPSPLVILTFIFLALCIGSLQLLWSNRIGKYVEGIAIVASLAYLFMTYTYTNAIMIFSFATMTYAQMLTIVDPEKVKFRRHLLDQLSKRPYKKITQPKEWQRIALDMTIVVVVSSGGLIFLIWAPETFGILKFFIGISFIMVGFEMIKRLANYMTTTIYFCETSKQLMIISLLESRQFPLDHLEKIKIESKPDILRLHPLFTFMTDLVDFTTAFSTVLRLNFPGEHIYLTPKDATDLYEYFRQHIFEQGDDAVKEIKPFWHPSHLKRLLWKGYFAVTVKGISAYTALLFVLYFINAPTYLIIVSIFAWWLFNLYVSDRVLVASTDATKVSEGWLYEIVKQLSERAAIKQPQLYLIDSSIHNGLATGMTIGRGTIMLTTGTTEFSKRTVEAIIAHEIAHIKYRDILMNQIGRMLFFVVVGLTIYFNFDYFELLAQNLVLLTIAIYVMIILFPIYLSILSQFTEMRADYLAAKLLSKKQMADGLMELGRAEDDRAKQSVTYCEQLDEKKSKKDTISHLSRGSWLLRFIEFQFQLHPPLYFRIYSLQKNVSWKETVIMWLKARLTESLPDFLRRKSKYI